MKKILFTVVSMFVFFGSFAQSPCTPDKSITTRGLYPSKLNAKTNNPYSQTLQFKFPNDTTVPIFGKISIDSGRIQSITHLPYSFTYKCSSPRCTYIGGANGCALITGNPVDSQIN